MKSRKNRRIWAKVITVAFALAFSFCLLSAQLFADSALKEGGFAAQTGDKIPQYVAGEILVKFKSVATEKYVGSINSSYGSFVIYTSPYAGFKRIKIPSDKTVIEMVELYGKDPLVEYAEPNYIFYAYWTPNDTYYPLQWHFHADQINMPSAWDVELGGHAGVIVAVVDTGVAYETYGPYQRAPDLAGTNFVPGWDFVNNDSHPNDDNGHGTHVTGTIAQTTNNSLGVAGIAYNTSIMPIKVLDASGSGSSQQVADGIDFATDNGADVINLSLGMLFPSSTIENAVQRAYNKDVVICAATGNSSLPIISYPAAYDECIAVGATGFDKARVPYSNYGTGMELMAPGGDTSVDLNNDGYADGILQQTFSEGDPTNFAYWFYQGTSMATPHVVGVIALMLSRGAQGVENIRNILHSTTEDLGDPGYDTVYGYGLIDAASALSAIAKTILEVDPTSLDFGEVGKSSSKTLTLRAYNYGGGTLSGNVSDNRDWISVSPSSFEGNDNTISVIISTSELEESSTPFTGTVTVDSNGGTKTVEVSVTIIPTGAVSFPNPFSLSEHTHLAFWGSSIPLGKVRVYNLAGELIRTLTETSGDSKVSWDGRNDWGDKIATGTYLFTVEDNSNSFVRGIFIVTD